MRTRHRKSVINGTIKEKAPENNGGNGNEKLRCTQKRAIKLNKVPEIAIKRRRMPALPKVCSAGLLRTFRTKKLSGIFCEFCRVSVSISPRPRNISGHVTLRIVPNHAMARELGELYDDATGHDRFQVGNEKHAGRFALPVSGNVSCCTLCTFGEMLRKDCIWRLLLFSFFLSFLLSFSFSFIGRQAG